MTDSFVTQCPHCRTSFRISRAQLGAAHGAVRCGACMRVFNAAQQLLVDQNRASKPATPAPASAPGKPVAPAPVSSAAQPSRAAAATPAARPAQPAATEKQSVDTLWIHDDLDLDSLDLDGELAKLEEQEMHLSREFLATDSAPKPAERLLRGEPREQDEAHDGHYDESWAESLIENESHKPAVSVQPLAEPPPRPMAQTQPAPPKAEPASTGKPAGEASQARAEPALGSQDEPETIDDSSYRGATEPAQQQAARTVRNEPALRNESLLSLNDDPLRLDWQQPKKPWGRWIGWGLLNLIAAAALAAQYLSYHFEELARQDQYRPWFESLCPEIGCELPSKVDISQIRSTNLVVRSHPQYMDALMVDAILYNRARFAQPFPLLELRFADLNGQLIASSRFRPSEYLNGELAGQNEMPPQTPIHISLEIKDPGAEAVNYSLSFHSPE